MENRRDRGACGLLPSMGSHRVGHNWSDSAASAVHIIYTYIQYMYWTHIIIMHSLCISVQFSCVQLFMTPWTTAHQPSLSITSSRSLLKLMSIESVMSSNHLILCRPLLILPSIFHSIRVFSNESALRIRWPKDWSFNFSISPSNEYSRLIYFRINWFDIPAVQGISVFDVLAILRVFSTTTIWKHQFLYFHTNCEIICFSSVKNTVGSLIGIALNL